MLSGHSYHFVFGLYDSSYAKTLYETERRIVLIPSANAHRIALSCIVQRFSHTSFTLYRRDSGCALMLLAFPHSNSRFHFKSHTVFTAYSNGRFVRAEMGTGFRGAHR